MNEVEKLERAFKLMEEQEKAPKKCKALKKRGRRPLKPNPRGVVYVKELSSE